MAKGANTNKRGAAAKPAKAAAKGKPAAKKKTASKPAAKARKPVAKPAAKRGKPEGTVKKLLAAVISRVKGGAKAKPKPKAKPKAAAKARPARPAARAKPAAKPRPAPKAATAKKPAAPAKSAATKPAAAARPHASKAPVATKSTAPTAKAVPAHVAAPAARSGGKVAVAVAVPPAKTQTALARHQRKATAPLKVAGNEVIRPTLPAGYKPSAKEPYMGPLQVEYFRQKLNKWRTDLVEESKQTIDNLRDEVRDVGDEAERATRETENSLELRTRDRYRKLISKIDKALRRIEEGEYGYCEETGEEIGLDRLGARPIATLCLDAQERWEHRQRQMGD